MSDKPAFDKNRFNVAETKEREALLEAAQRFLALNAPKVKPIVTCEQLSLGLGYARIGVADADHKLAPVFGYARRSRDGRWEVLAVGTGFDLAFYKKHAIPDMLRK